MLDTLPAELVDEIAGLLDDRTDISALRLTCRAICQRTTRAFARAWFTKIQVHLCPRGLARLEEIVGHENARLAVRELHAGRSARMYGDRIVCRHCDPRVLFPGNPTGCLDDLHEAAGAFTNCDKFILELARGCISNPHVSALAFALSLIAQTGSQPHDLTLRISQTSPQTPHGSHVTSTLLRDPNFHGSWGTLRRLRVKWWFADVQMEEVPTLVRFVALAPNLESLDLNFDEDIPSGGPDFVGSGVFLDGLLTENWQPALKALQLTSLGRVGQSTLTRFVRHFRETLTSVAFGFFSIDNGRWRDIMALLDSGEFPNLGTFTLFYCLEETENVDLMGDDGLLDGDNDEQADVLFCPLRRDVNIPGHGRIELCSDEIMVAGHKESVIRAVRFRGQRA